MSIVLCPPSLRVYLFTTKGNRPHRPTSAAPLTSVLSFADSRTSWILPGGYAHRTLFPGLESRCLPTGPGIGGSSPSLPPRPVFGRRTDPPPSAKNGSRPITWPPGGTRWGASFQVSSLEPGIPPSISPPPRGGDKPPCNEPGAHDRCRDRLLRFFVGGKRDMAWGVPG